MKRRLFNLAAGVSLVLCVATGILWVRSLTVISSVRWSSRDRARAISQHVISFGGSFTYIRETYFYDPRIFRSHEVEAHPMRFEEESMPLERARWLYVDVIPPIHVRPPPTDFGQDGGYEFSIAYWALALVTGVVPATSAWKWFARRRRFRDAASRACPFCGYDLRATPERCPECGAEAKPQPAKGAAA